MIDSSGPQLAHKGRTECRTPLQSRLRRGNVGGFSCFRSGAQLWKKHHGNVNLSFYDQVGGAYYLGKTAALVEFDYCVFNLDCVTQPLKRPLRTPKKSSYVPDHVRHTLSGKTLALREEAM